jgi:hypothetical protein
LRGTPFYFEHPSSLLRLHAQRRPSTAFPGVIPVLTSRDYIKFNRSCNRGQVPNLSPYIHIRVSKRDEGALLLFFLFARFRCFCSGNDLVRLQLRNKIIMVKLHRE